MTGSVRTGVTSLAATDSCLTGSAGTGVTSLAGTDSCPQSKCREIKISYHRREMIKISKRRGRRTFGGGT